MFPSHSTPNRFVPRGSNNHFNYRSPQRHGQEFYPSPNHPQAHYYSPNEANRFSPRNMTPMGSPVNTPHRHYSPNPNSSFDSPQRQYSSSSPGRPYWNNKRSFNQSRNSDFYSSGNSSYNDSSSPYGNRRKSWKGNDNSEKGYNIRNYINPSMLENPWAELEKESSKT